MIAMELDGRDRKEYVHSMVPGDGATLLGDSASLKLR